jgi:hypothetical protein
MLLGRKQYKKMDGRRGGGEYERKKRDRDKKFRGGGGVLIQKYSVNGGWGKTADKKRK